MSDSGVSSVEVRQLNREELIKLINREFDGVTGTIAILTTVKSRELGITTQSLTLCMEVNA